MEARIGQEGIEVYGFSVRRGGKRPSLNTAGPGRALQGGQWDCICKSTLAPSHPMLDSGGWGAGGGEDCANVFGGGLVLPSQGDPTFLGEAGWL